MCGLAGMISTEKTAFNINHFNILGTLNDERGGDSCGIFIDGQVEYGIAETKYFRDFTINTNYPKSASIALLHCRKTSAGYTTNLSQAQPVILRDQNNKIEFVLMHNGIITNADALAKKYLPELDIFNLSDSQIMAHIMYHCGYGVLSEYTGCAVFIIVDYRKATPEVLIFKGSSCYNENKAKSERPLYYMVTNGKFYFSSMYYSLYCIDSKKTIYDIPVNQLLTVQNNTLYVVKSYNRTKLTKVNYSYSGVVYYNGSYSNSYLNDMIRYNRNTGTYILNNTAAHGEYTTYPSGYVIKEKYLNNSTTADTFYFFRGRLMYNKNCFDFLTSLEDLFDEDVLINICPAVIDYFAYNPRIMNKQYCLVTEAFNYALCNDMSWVSLFSDGNIFTIKDGRIISKYIYPADAINRFKQDVKDVYFNFEELEKQIFTFISSKIVDTDAVQ